MQTFTFYSYKGGTGRSLLLANAARYLALLGKKVVALDFDFEAPGLHYKLNISDTGARAADVVPIRGVVDFLLAIAQGKSSAERLSDYVVSVPLPQGCHGELRLMPAGSAPSGEYWKQLSALLQHDRHPDREGNIIAACLELKARIEEEFKADFLLIDSRTGITELAGVATTLLSDKVVCLVLNNRESLTGTRAVMQSFGRAVRLNGQEPIEILPVLSRIPEHNQSTLSQILAFLNEPGTTPETTLKLKQLFELRTDSELARTEKLHVGSGKPVRQSKLHQDYMALFAMLLSVNPAEAEAAMRRQVAVRTMREWLTERPDSHRRRRETPNCFDDEQIDEGVQFGNGKQRYADLVVFSDKNRTEALMVVEYVNDIASSDVWKWWEKETRLRCVVLTSSENEFGWMKRRIFTRGRRSNKFTERDDQSGWAVKWPISYSAMDDPGDRSVGAMLAAVQRGENGFINLLVKEWQHTSFVTLHGGSPYRPVIARQILDGLAEVKDLDTEAHILRLTVPDPFERSDRGIKPMDQNSLEELTTCELHAPLWWRLSAEAKVKHRGRTCIAGIDLLARDIMGLSFNQNRDFRRALGRLVCSTDDEQQDGAYRLLTYFSDKELKYQFTDSPPPELIRQTALHRALNAPRSESGWKAAEEAAQEALDHDKKLSALLRNRDGHLSIVTTNLLGAYDPETAQITIFNKLVGWCARVLNLDVRALTNIVFMHETVHALSHLGRDLDDQAWPEFALPTSRDLTFRPSALHTRLAQYFCFRLIERLGDTHLMTAFEKLSDHQPAEYRVWREMRDVPIETVRQILIHARTGADKTLR